MDSRTRRLRSVGTEAAGYTRGGAESPHRSGLANQLLAFASGKTTTDWIFEREGEPPDDRDLQQHVFRPVAEAVGIYFPDSACTLSGGSTSVGGRKPGRRRLRR